MSQPDKPLTVWSFQMIENACKQKAEVHIFMQQKSTTHSASYILSK